MFVIRQVGMRLVSDVFKKLVVEPHTDIIVPAPSTSRVLDFIARTLTSRVNAHNFVLTIDFAHDGSATAGYVSGAVVLEYQARGILTNIKRIFHMTRFGVPVNAYLGRT